MALTFSDVDGGDYANTAAPQATAAWTPPTHDLIVCVYLASHTSTNTVATPPTLAGNGLTWVRIVSYDDPTTLTDFVAIFAADNSAGGATNGATSLTFPDGDSMTGDSMLFMGVDGVDLSGGVAAAFVQAVTARGTSAAPALSFAAAANANNRPLMAVLGTGSGQTVTAPGSWVKWDQLSWATPNRIDAVMTRGDAFDASPVGALTSSANWVAVGVEIKAAASGVSASIGVATETETALPLSAAKATTVGVAAETDSALSLSATKSVSIGVATETDAALGLAHTKATSIGVATETDDALVLTGHTAGGQSASIGVATETDEALSIAGAKATTIGIATETDEALSLTATEVLVAHLGVATELDFAFPLDSKTARVLEGFEIGRGSWGGHNRRKLRFAKGEGRTTP